MRYKTFEDALGSLFLPLQHAKPAYMIFSLHLVLLLASYWHLQAA